MDRGGTWTQQKANFEQEDFEGIRFVRPGIASAAESTHSVLTTAAFLLMVVESRVGGRSCG